MIIDSHCHAGKGDGLTGPWDTAAPLDAYLRRARRAGISKTVLLPAFHSNYREANREVGGIVASRPERFFGFAMVHPSRDAGRIGEMVREAVERFGFRGIKVHRHDARITREICETARLFAVPVLYDVMGEASGIDLQVAGIILVIVGAIGFVASLIFWSSWGGFGRRDGGQNTTIVERDGTAGSTR